MILVGGADIVYNSNFRLYLTTELSNPNFTADTAIKVNLINFTVTRRGLEEQLLGDVSGHQPARNVMNFEHKKVKTDLI